MARANLNIDESLTKAWNEANETGTVRYLTINVKGESVVCNGVTPVMVEESSSTSLSSTSTSWWSTIIDQATNLINEQQTNAKNNPPTLPPFASPGGTAFRITPLMWLVFTEPEAKTLSRVTLISLTPEGTAPRAKMLYASARDDIKRALGASRFEPDYHVNEVNELNANAFNLWRNRDRNEAMSSQELVQAAVNKEVNRERSAAPRMIATMTKVPFKPDTELVTVLSSEFSSSGANNPFTGWIEVQVNSASLMSPGNKTTPTNDNTNSESLSMVKQGKENDIETLADTIAGTNASVDPRFFVIAPNPPGNNVVILVYHCPESAKPKSRMLYSTAKAAMTAAATDSGVLITKVVETRDKDDVLTALKDASSLSLTSVSSSSTLSPTKSHSSGSEETTVTTPSVTSPVTGNRFGGIGLPGLSPGMAGMTLKSTTTTDTPPGDEFGSSRPSRPGRGGNRFPGMMALPGLTGTGSSTLFGEIPSTTTDEK